MSAHQNKIPESKSKSKFQSLNINTIYQVTQTRLKTDLPVFADISNCRGLPANSRLRTYLPSMVSRVSAKSRQPDELQ